MTTPQWHLIIGFVWATVNCWFVAYLMYKEIFGKVFSGGMIAYFAWSMIFITYGMYKLHFSSYR